MAIATRLRPPHQGEAEEIEGVVGVRGARGKVDEEGLVDSNPGFRNC